MYVVCVCVYNKIVGACKIKEIYVDVERLRLAVGKAVLKRDPCPEQTMQNFQTMFMFKGRNPISKARPLHHLRSDKRINYLPLT